LHGALGALGAGVGTNSPAAPITAGRDSFGVGR
jgi:hypothetical protein